MEQGQTATEVQEASVTNEKPASRPLIIVGMPRSGTSFLTRTINQSLNYFVIDDFYIVQKVDAKNFWGDLNRNQADELLSDMFSQIHARSTLESGMKSLKFSRSDLLSLKDWMNQSDFSGRKWSDVVDSFLSQLVKRANAQNWGYKTPQDHLHIGTLSEAFPTAFFIFVTRDPRDVLLSYKNITRDLPFYSQDDLRPLDDADHQQSSDTPAFTPAPEPTLGSKLTSFIKTEIQRLKRGDDPRRYNPYVQGAAWRLAADSYFRWKERLPDRILLIKYESIMDNKEHVLHQIAGVLESSLGDILLHDTVTNTSFRPGKKKKRLTDGEIWLADQAMAGMQTKLGYTYPVPGFRIRYIPTLCFFFVRSGLFFAMQFASSRDRRKRMARNLKQVLFGSKL